MCSINMTLLEVQYKKLNEKLTRVTCFNNRSVPDKFILGKTMTYVMTLTMT